MGISKNNARNLLRYLLAGTACGFLLLLTVFVLKESGTQEALGDRRKEFLLFMAADVLLLLGLTFWSIRWNGQLQGFCTAGAMLLGIGSAYQFLYESYLKYLLMTAGAVVAAIGTYLLMRGKSKLPDHWFYVLIAAVVALLGANLLLGEDYGTGARLWISIGSISVQPGEPVKVLLMLIGSLAYRSKLRSFLYCLISGAACGIMLLLHDMGSAVVILSSFILMTYLLFDSRKLSLGIIAAALLLFLGALQLVPYAAQRIHAWTNAMVNTQSSQQRNFITGVLLGGFRGLGIENAHHFTGIFSSREDGALAGVMAVYGVPVIFITLCCYGVLVAQPIYNRSVYPSNYLILSQISMMIFCQVLLNYGGALDLLPFTGITAPLISAGGSSQFCFGVLLGLQAASLRPKIPITNEEV